VAPNGFGGGLTTIFMVLPFLFIIAGVAYIALASPSRRKAGTARRDRVVRVLPVGAQHPLSHMRTKMKPVSQARQPVGKTGQKRRSEPPGLKSV
jgi:hypothetical protein